MRKKVMNNVYTSIDLQGDLDIEWDQHTIKIECKGQFIKLTFSSFTALRKFMAFNRKVHFPISIQEHMKCFSVDCYLSHILIGEFRPYFKPNWLSFFLNVKHVKIFPKQLIKYFLNT